MHVFNCQKKIILKFFKNKIILKEKNENNYKIQYILWYVISVRFNKVFQHVSKYTEYFLNLKIKVSPNLLSKSLLHKTMK